MRLVLRRLRRAAADGQVDVAPAIVVALASACLEIHVSVGGGQGVTLRLISIDWGLSIWGRMGSVQ